MLDKKFSNDLTSNFMWNWRKLPLKHSVCYVSRMEKTAEVSDWHKRFAEKLWKMKNDLAVR